MSYLFKDFLNLEDVGEYLNQYGYSYDPEIEEDYYRLKDTILDLHNEQKLSIVFYYDDFAAIKTLRFCENLGVEEIKDEEFETYISGYFHVPEVSSILRNGANIAIIESSYRYYLLHDKDNLPIHDREEYRVEAGHKFTSIEFGNSSIPSVVELSDLRFPKADLDKLFNNKNSELERAKDELADVKEQNAKLIANKEENKSTGSFSMGALSVAHSEDKTYEELVEALTAANDKIKQHEEDINRLNDQLNKQADNPTDKHLYDWQAMDKNQYPPELHLTIEVWKKYYQAGDIEYITQFNTGKFNRIAKEFKLKDGNLKDRIRTLLTPLVRKLKAPSLIESFEVIDIIHIDKLEQN